MKSIWQRFLDLYNRFVDPLLHMPGEKSDGLFRHGLLLMGGTQIANVCNMLFQLIALRMLTSEDYGEVAAMLGVFTLVYLPMGAMLGASTRFTSDLIKHERAAEIMPMVVSISRDLLLACILICALVVIGHERIIGFFKLETTAPLYITVLSICFAVHIPLIVGVFHGMQAFAWACLVRIAWGFGRFLFALIILASGTAAIGALAGHALGVGASICTGIIALIILLPSANLKPKRPVGFYSYLARYLLAYGAFAILMNADVIIAKHYFSAADAGAFAKAAVISRLIIFLPMPVTLAMFPKIVTRTGNYSSTRLTLLKALLMTAGITAIATVACLLFPGFLLLVLSGTNTPTLIPLIRMMSLALCPLSLVFVIMNFQLAQKKFGITLPLVFCAIAYLSITAVWHKSLLSIAIVLMGSSVIAATSCASTLPWNNREQNSAPDSKI